MSTTSLHNFVLYDCYIILFYMTVKYFVLRSENCINIDYTYCGPNQLLSVIDHFTISSCLSSSVAVDKTIRSVSNISDHLPVFLDVECHSPRTNNIPDRITYQIPM